MSPGSGTSGGSSSRSGVPVRATRRAETTVTPASSVPVVARTPPAPSSAAAGLGAGGVFAATGTLLAGVTVVSARRVARTGTPERDDEPPEVPDPGDG